MTTIIPYFHAKWASRGTVSYLIGI